VVSTNAISHLKYALIRRAGCLFSHKGTFAALATAAQIIPGVDAAGVAVLPVELDCVAADGLRAGRLHGRGIHGQDGGWPGLWLPYFTAIRLALLDAGGAGAGITQPGKAPGAVVAVNPIDLHALALRDEHADLLSRDADAR